MRGNKRLTQLQAGSTFLPNFVLLAIVFCVCRDFRIRRGIGEGVEAWVPGFPKQLLDSKDVGCLGGVNAMSKRLCSILVIAIAVLLVSPAVWGKRLVVFSGTVTDKSGSPVSGATVTVTSAVARPPRMGRGTILLIQQTPPARIVCKRSPAKSLGCLPGFSNLFLGRVQVTETEFTRRLASQQGDLP